jgi:hypothetical protein
MHPQDADVTGSGPVAVYTAPRVALIKGWPQIYNVAHPQDEQRQEMARPAGLEPAAPGLEIQGSVTQNVGLTSA